MALRGGVAVATLLVAGAVSAGPAAGGEVRRRAAPRGRAGAAADGWDPGWAAPGAGGVGGSRARPDAADAPRPELVSMNYRLEVDPGTSAVPFTLLLFAPAHVEEISAEVDGEVLPLRMTHAEAPRLEGEIELPAGVASSGQVSLEVGYRVTDAVREDGAGVRVGLPMLAVDWAPAEPTPGMFQAEVILPEGMVAREIFPVTPGGGAAPGVAHASLQVLPAVVQVRARPEGSLGLSLPGVLELLVLVAVIACGMAGLRLVRRAR